MNATSWEHKMHISSALSLLGMTWPQAQQYLTSQVFTWAMAAQLAAGALSFLLAHMASRALRSWIGSLMDQTGLGETDPNRQRNERFLHIAGPFLSFLFLGTAFCVFHYFKGPAEGLRVLFALSMAAFLVRFLTAASINRYWKGTLTSAVWIWTILSIVGIVRPLYSIDERIYFALGNLHVSIFTIIRAFVISLIFFWLSRNSLVMGRLWLRAGSDLPNATQVLIYKLCRALLIWISVIFILHYLGIDMKAFALFGGALGLGIGFGLQKIYVNLLSGYIILADKSIKPGDVIQLGTTYGTINFLGSRYVSVVTRDAVEHLIPNENLITGEVINWSYSNNLLRLRFPIGIAYESDLERATSLSLQAATDTSRILKEPKPDCFVKDFGDNGLNLELRVWINDPQNGIGSVRNELLRGILRRFKEEGIELPYSQMVLLHKSTPEGLDRD